MSLPDKQVGFSFNTKILDRFPNKQNSTGKLIRYYTINCSYCKQYLEYSIDIISNKTFCYYCKQPIEL